MAAVLLLQLLQLLLLLLIQGPQRVPALLQRLNLLLQHGAVDLVELAQLVEGDDDLLGCCC